jgi:hypothetical protein
MRRFFVFMLALLFIVSIGFLVACGDGGEPKKKSDRGESDWSASSVVKDIEEMKKASEKEKAPAQSQPAAQPASQESKKQR